MSRGVSPAVNPRVRALLRVFALAGGLALAFHLAHGQLGLGGHSLDGFANNWIYDGRGSCWGSA